ncbi:MAG: glycoside hydrolase family 2 TIM barrel-domain containing protein, partial [Niabella sp.]
ASKVVIESKLAGDAPSEMLFKRSTPVVLKPGSDTSINISVPGVSGYKLWSVENPALYYLESSLTVNGVQSDHVAQPMGFRWFRFDADSGFYLNGKQVKLMGANRHQDRPPYGPALDYDMHKQDMYLLKDMGGNFLRTAHYPQAKEVLDLADGLGLLVWEEIPLVNEVTRNAAYSENAQRMLREMIKQHYNHPSIIIWAYMNEIYWAHRFKPENELPSRNEYTIALAKTLDKECRELDPHRYTAMAMHNYPAYEETGLGSIPMIAGWNLYHGWYYDKYEDFGKFMDGQKEKYPGRIHIISEYGAGAHTGIYSNKPEKFDFSMEGQIAFTQSFIKQIMARPYIAGASIWNLADFSSESRVDATPHINNKGLTTADRKPKDAYFLSQALFSGKPVTTIGYPFRNKWLYAAQSADDTLAPVKMNVFSNEKSLDLYVDGKGSGKQQVTDGMASWNLRLPAGKHTLSVGPSLNTPDKPIEVEIIPFKLPGKGLDLAVNIGANYTFIDERTGLQWIEEQEYRKGSWGVIGGERLYVADKIGTKEDILNINYEDALYQTMRVNVEGFKADVPDGVYEVELMMVDYIPKSRRFVNDEAVNFNSGKRVFTIEANKKPVAFNLDLGGDYGQNVPVKLKFRCITTNDQGIDLRFIPVKGKPVLSAVRIRYSGY